MGRKFRASVLEGGRVSGFFVQKEYGVWLTIAGAGEFLVWRICAYGVSCFGTNGARDGWLEEIA